MLQRWRPFACQRRLFCKAVALQKAAAGSGYLDRPHGAAAQRDTQSAGARLKEYHLQHITVTVTETARGGLVADAVQPCTDGSRAIRGTRRPSRA